MNFKQINDKTNKGLITRVVLTFILALITTGFTIYFLITNKEAEAIIVLVGCLLMWLVCFLKYKQLKMISPDLPQTEESEIE